MTEIGLVSCTKSKRDQPHKPAKLYDESAFFRKASNYAETNHDKWYVLSAKHGLLKPNAPPIEPYEETLSGATVEQKRDWAQSVFAQFKEEALLSDGTHLIFHAGRDYYDELLPLIEETPVVVETPTDGLRYDETLAWYNDRL